MLVAWAVVAVQSLLEILAGCARRSVSCLRSFWLCNGTTNRCWISVKNARDLSTSFAAVGWSSISMPSREPSWPRLIISLSILARYPGWMSYIHRKCCIVEAFQFGHYEPWRMFNDGIDRCHRLPRETARLVQSVPHKSVTSRRPRYSTLSLMYLQSGWKMVSREAEKLSVPAARCRRPRSQGDR